MAMASVDISARSMRVVFLLEKGASHRAVQSGPGVVSFKELF